MSVVVAITICIVATAAFALVVAFAPRAARFAAWVDTYQSGRKRIDEEEMALKFRMMGCLGLLASIAVTALAIASATN